MKCALQTGDDSAFDERFDSVDGQVHDDLLDLALVCFHIAEGWIQNQGDFYVFTQELGKHFFHIGGETIEIEDGGRQDLLTAEGQQLFSQRSGAVTSFLDFQGVFVECIVCAQLPLKHSAVADNYAEKVIEVMRDSSGEPADTDCYETRGDKRIKAVLRVPEHRFFVLWGGLTHTTVE